MNWSAELSELADREEPFVIVTVAGTRGSTPRETGAKMFVTTTRTIGTIGGGQLEYECAAVACQWLREPVNAKTYARTFTLGTNCGQCCGGVAEILFEQIVPSENDWLDELRKVSEAGLPAMMITAGDSRTGVSKRFVTTETVAIDDNAIMAIDMLKANAPACRVPVTLRGNLQVPALFESLRAGQFEIVLFGAGHVGSALVANLAGLNCQVNWIDSRSEAFPDPMPANVTAVCIPDPESLVDRVNGGAYFLVMTHSHAMDLAICARILARSDFSYCGLIGSRSKRRQFEKRLRALGLSDLQLQRLVCPIGIDGIKGKTPAEIAIATTAQLLRLREAELATVDKPTRKNKRQIKR